MVSSDAGWLRYFSSDPTILAEFKDASGNLVDVRFDHVSPTPEPATWALMMVAVGGVGAVLRTRRRTLEA